MLTYWNWYCARQSPIQGHHFSECKEREMERSNGPYREHQEINPSLKTNSNVLDF